MWSSGRAGERAVQHRGGGEVERLAGVPKAAGDLPPVEEPWSRLKQVARLAELRRQLDERAVGFDTAYRTYQTLSRQRSARSR
jgi:hypothetical protein